MISKKITKSIQSFLKIWGYKIIPLDDKNRGDNVINAEFGKYMKNVRNLR